jgi:hypothetical protein
VASSTTPRSRDLGVPVPVVPPTGIPTGPDWSGTPGRRIQATARILKNVIEVQAGSESWIAFPLASAQSPLGRAIASLFSTRYEVRDPTAVDPVVATISYEIRRDEILIQVGEQKWRTRSALFGPTLLEYGRHRYFLHEKITGHFALLEEDEVVARGQCRFRSVVLEDYPAEMERFLAQLAVGLLIRTLVSELAL